MFRKLFWLILTVLFYFWVTESDENMNKVRSVCQYVAGKLGKVDLEFSFNANEKKQKW